MFPIEIPCTLGRHSPDQDLILSVSCTQAKWIFLRRDHLRKIFNDEKRQGHFFMWMDFKRANLKLHCKTTMDVFWRVNDSLSRPLEQWRLRTSEYLMPQLNGQYPHKRHVCDRSRGGFCCKAPCLEHVPSTIFVSLKIRQKKTCVFLISQISFAHTWYISDTCEATFNWESGVALPIFDEIKIFHKIMQFGLKLNQKWSPEIQYLFLGNIKPLTSRGSLISKVDAPPPPPPPHNTPSLWRSQVAFSPKNY